MAPATFVFFLLVFTIVGVVFLFIHLLMGSFIRPSVPDPEKLTIYECGEPTVGSAWVQFDLRYYVVALLFVIFDVEVAFFFPWATVFGKANQLASFDPPVRESPFEKREEPTGAAAEMEAKRKLLTSQLEPIGVSADRKVAMRISQRHPKTKEVTLRPIEPGGAGAWAQIVFWDVVIFFGVLMVGFAYVWRRGDIDWVRAYGHHHEPAIAPEKPLEQPAPRPTPPAAVH